MNGLWGVRDDGIAWCPRVAAKEMLLRLIKCRNREYEIHVVLSLFTIQDVLLSAGC
jgi:hypothetical protein